MNRKIRLFIGIALLTAVAFMLLNDAAIAQDTNVIRINISVTESSSDRAVVGLEKENFQLYEDNVSQDIATVTSGNVAGEYVLAYKSKNESKDGKFRRVRVRLVDAKGKDVPLTVRSKTGYYAPTN